MNGLQTKVSHNGDALELLDWDSQHFGFRIARAVGPELDAGELGKILGRARRSGVRLVYWAAEMTRAAPRHLLEEFRGSLVDRKVTFARSLTALEAASEKRAPCVITVHAQAEPSPQLVQLAVTAGEFSRFRQDQRIGAESFRRLYEIWLLRSIQGELADVVLVAAAGETCAQPLGFVTVALQDGDGSIGLIAVSESARGRGIGRSLVEAGHRWLRERDAWRVTVITQLENHVACRLYARCGYEQMQLQHVYHFWP
jgi:dTDP-4-amino-4,6-dideoxy-D-galactose acyltransferase